jgi:hypothetical protein
LGPVAVGRVVGGQVGREGAVVDVDGAAGILDQAAGVVKAAARRGRDVDRADERPAGGVLLEQVLGVRAGDGGQDVPGEHDTVFELFQR